MLGSSPYTCAYFVQAELTGLTGVVATIVGCFYLHKLPCKFYKQNSHRRFAATERD